MSDEPKIAPPEASLDYHERLRQNQPQFPPLPEELQPEE